MSPLDAFGHLINLFLPAVGVALVTALAAKLVWRTDLGSISWRPLFLIGAVTGMFSVLASLMLFGRDGTIGGYGLLVASCAVSQWWRGFGPGRR